MNYVVDASVAAKFYLEEEGHEQALRIFRSSERLIAPSMLLAEVGNVLWKKVRLGEIDLKQAQAAAEDFKDDLVQVVPLEELHDRALALCLSLNHPIYDCYYLALAEREDLTLITTDRRLLGVAEDSPLSGRVIDLVDAPIVELRMAPTMLEELLRLCRGMVEADRRRDARENPDGKFLFRPGRLPSSPAYSRLEQVLSGLSWTALADFIAVSWFSRRENWDMRRLQSDAERLVERADPKEWRYILSLAHDFETGLRRLESRPLGT